MGKKRKNQDSTDSIDANKRENSKKIKEVIADDIMQNEITEMKNIDTDVQSNSNKKRKEKKIKAKIADDAVENVNEDRETHVQTNKKKKRRDKKIKGEIAENIVENQDSEINVQVRSTKKRKDKKNKDGLSKDNLEKVNDGSESVVQSTNNFGTISNNATPKKIIFVDDEPQEVSVSSNNKTKKSKLSKKTKEYNDDILKEEDVKDEDIDKFCDELDEEDNKQYENWVQLIEATLSSNKKKPK
ncbi:hypothetical protein RR46_04832 [Papilio xuthus]|uniref:Uncharacterized protein n=1 Tax=Papilio xuthus TaxID=66420 RepID=A0A194Q3D3_PAPXU|nr:hypothetical protein RR46_04832 [Papilio xuthus]